MSKLLNYGDEGRQKILDGVEKLTKTVAVTMGPMGKNVIVGKFIGAPTITKDGVSVAREVVLADPIEELGCQLVKEAAGRTAAIAGDGTTTATVLTHAILKNGMELINTGYNPLHLRDGMEWAKKTLVEELSKLTKPLDSDEDLRHIATISANNDSRLGNIIAEAFIQVNRDGFVTAEARPGVEHSVRVIDGIELNSGYLSSLFLENGLIKRELDSAYIWICNWEINSFIDKAFIDAVNKAAAFQKPILLLCKDLKKEALANFVHHFKGGRLDICPVKIPKFGKNQQKWLEDFSILTNAVIFGDEGLEISNFDTNCLGFAKKIIVDSSTTKIIEPNLNKELVQGKQSLYLSELNNNALGDLDRKDLQDRIKFLSTKVATIRVGYSTELELREKADRVEDAIFAVRAAIEEGYVVGGGYALLRAAHTVETYRMTHIQKEWHPAIKVLLEACKAPAKQIIQNANQDAEFILKELGSYDDFGYNTGIGKFGNLVEMGVIDPKKVTRTALENATSIALLLITTEAIIAENPHQESGWQPPAGYRLPSETGLNHKH